MDLGQRLAERQKSDLEASEQAAAETKANEEIFQKHRREFLDIQQSSCEQFDKTVLTLSTSLLALSLTFLKDLVRLPQALALPVLIFSWVALGLSVALTFVSFIASQRAADTEIQTYEKYFKHGQKNAFEKPNAWNRLTHFCNNATTLFFLVGLALTIYVVSVNTLKEARRMSTGPIEPAPPQIDPRVGVPMPPRPSLPIKPEPTDTGQPPSSPPKPEDNEGK